MTAYAVVTPLRNEAETLPRLAECVTGQTVRPRSWVLVENGSEDATPSIAAALAVTHPWIEVVSVEPAPADERGAPIVHAIHAGLERVEPSVGIVAQLDADIALPDDYFGRLVALLDENPRLGIVSGTCHELEDGTWRERFVTEPNVWGAARAYRRACLDAVLPLEPRTGWDSIDVAQANALGWRTSVDRSLVFRHLRPEASRERTQWGAWAAQGRVSHYLGYRFSYLLLRAAFRMPRDPAAAALVTAYVGETIRRSPRCERPGVREWVREGQRLRHLRRRAAAARGQGAAEGGE